ncbi:hypothetical protein TI05_06225 [Achromatium sp. WMS3]|nr:hypothetical protein TI05_06225 [Achromatium sp. WMS3]
MPELPEVETIRRGIAPYLEGDCIVNIITRIDKLRWPIPTNLKTQVINSQIDSITRRAKYLLINLPHGSVIIHLGMSGSLRILPSSTPPQPHDHFDLVLSTKQCLRLRDPRRFGAVLWQLKPVMSHPLLQNLGPEPLESNFTGSYLMQMATKRRLAIKNFIMDSKVVSGVGNIYANESLFQIGVHPQRSCQDLTMIQYNKLVSAIKQILSQAITQGGTTLRDFSDVDGKPGYFAQSLQVYGRDGLPCIRCNTLIRKQRFGQRSSFFCPQCQQ